MSHNVVPDGELVEYIEHLDAVLVTVRLVCGKILTPLLCIVGFVANILNVAVLTRAWMSSSTNVYLTAVAICDLHYLLFSCLFSLWTYAYMRQVTIYAYAITFIHGTANLFSNTTTWLTVCFTLERYVAVSSPMLGRRFCTQKRARYAVIGIFIVSFIFTFPDYLKNVVIPPGNGTLDNSTSREYRVVSSNIEPLLIDVGYDYLNQIIFVLLPMILLIIFNSLLVRSVLKANQSRKNLVKPMSNIKSIPDAGSIRETGPYESSQHTPVIVKEALEASIKATVELTSGITQTFSQPGKVRILPNTHSRRPILGEQQRITLMLISIVIAFVILQLPSTVPTITANLWNAGVLNSTLIMRKYLHIYSNISNVLLIINAAMNFVFYSLFSAKFRQTFCMLFQQCQCTKRKQTRPICAGRPWEISCLLADRKSSHRSVSLPHGTSHDVSAQLDSSENLSTGNHVMR